VGGSSPLAVDRFPNSRVRAPWVGEGGTRYEPRGGAAFLENDERLPRFKESPCADFFVAGFRINRSSDISLRATSLRAGADALSVIEPDIAQRRVHRAKAVRRSYSAWRPCFSFEQVIDDFKKPRRVPQAPISGLLQNV